MKIPPPLPEKLMCKWEWDKLTLSERKSTRHCRCQSVCYKKQEEKEQIVDEAKGFWQKLLARL